MGFNSAFEGLNAELNPICHLLTLLEAHHILHVRRIKVNVTFILTLLVLLFSWGKTQVIPIKTESPLQMCSLGIKRRLIG